MGLLKIKSLETPFPGSLLVVPNDDQPHPGIILLHGSEGGGIPTWKIIATRLAAHGYAVMAYCYYGSTDQLVGPREILADIEVMDVVKALTWLKESHYVQGQKIALEGASRGAELGLLTASLLAQESDLVQLDALSLHSLSDVIWESWSWDWIDERCWLGEVPDSAELSTKSEKHKWNPKCGIDPRELPEHLKYAWKWKGQVLTPGQNIAAELIRTPTFITHGVKDDLWSVQQARNVEQKMVKSGTYCEAIYFENDGHRLDLDSANIRNERSLQFFAKFLK